MPETGPKVRQFFFGGQGALLPGILPVRQGRLAKEEPGVAAFLTEEPTGAAIKHFGQAPQILTLSHVACLPPIADGGRLDADFLGDLVVLEVPLSQSGLKPFRKNS